MCSLRRQGHPNHDAEDMTQAYFGRLLEKRMLAATERERGRLPLGPARIDEAFSGQRTRFSDRAETRGRPNDYPWRRGRGRTLRARPARAAGSVSRRALRAALGADGARPGFGGAPGFLRRPGPVAVIRCALTIKLPGNLFYWESIRAGPSGKCSKAFVQGSKITFKRTKSRGRPSTNTRKTCKPSEPSSGTGAHSSPKRLVLHSAR